MNTISENDTSVGSYNNEKNPVETKTFRRKLRRSLTPAEATLWTVIKNKQIDGLRFHRQFGIDKYVLDFYCPELKLAIELDGQSHVGREAYDQARTDYLEAHHNIHVLRFENDLVFYNVQAIIDDILRHRDGYRG